MEDTEFLQKFIESDFDLQTALMLWEKLAKQSEHYKEWEMVFRKAIFNKTWPSWKEGVNNFPLNAGYVLKGTGKINYNIDKQMIPQVGASLAAMNVALDPFLRVSYALAEGPYKKIVADAEQNQTIGVALRQMITTSPGAPTLEIVKPKTKR